VAALAIAALDEVVAGGEVAEGEDPPAAPVDDGTVGLGVTTVVRIVLLLPEPVGTTGV